MKTLDEHNIEQFKYYNERSRFNQNKPQKNGILCPECGKELYDTNPMMTLASNPPKKDIHCECGYKGYRLA